MTDASATPSACASTSTTVFSAISLRSSAERLPRMAMRMMESLFPFIFMMLGVTPSGRVRDTLSSLSRTSLKADSRSVP